MDKIPIAWGDESFLIDPAWQFITTGEFASKIWPFQGTEEIFLAYLPLSSFIQIPFLFLFKGSLFFSRLPYLLSFLGFLFFSYKIFKEHYKLKSTYIYFLLLLFWVDEGFSLSIRSARVEVYILFLASWILYNFFLKKNSILNFFLIGLMSIAHPNMWMFCLILFGFQFIQEKNNKYRSIGILLSLLPLLFYGYMANFDLKNIYQQLIVHGSEHNASAINGWPIFNHFYLRFWPNYATQPIIILVNLFIFIYSFKSILKNKFNKQSLLEFLFVCTSIYWILALAPFPRYTVSITFLIYLISIKIIVNNSLNPLYTKLSTWADKYKWYLLMLYALPFLGRNVLGILQYKERNPVYVKEWLDSTLNISNQKVLLIDASIAHFYSMDKLNVDFTLTYAVKKFDFQNYDKVFYITERAEPDSCEFIKMYQTPKGCLQPEFAGVQSYEGLRVYRVNTESAFRKLQRKY